MIFIDLENNPPPKGWIDKAEALTQKLIAAPTIAAKNVIIDANQTLWNELKDHLSSLSNQKCWYSESINAGAHCHVDHFRPKKEVIDEAGNITDGYWWLAFDWMNYRFSGPAPNVRKKSYFHVMANRALNYGDNCNIEDILFIDPLRVRDPECLAFDNEGRVKSKDTNTKTRNYIRAEYSIRRLNLNASSLIDKRKDKFRKASVLLIHLDNKIKLQAVTWDQSRENEIEAGFKELIQMCSKNSEFSAAVKFCLKSSSYDWALGIVNAAA
ncbi:MAG: hypothetical protein Q8K92_20580 [Leadbetterella sp.]|nr:hypothetical protein [Leadbetterella sp.]